MAELVFEDRPCVTAGSQNEAGARPGSVIPFFDACSICGEETFAGHGGGLRDVMLEAVRSTAIGVDLAAELASLYARHKEAVFRVALRYGTNRRDWAEDVVQDVFIALARELPALIEHDDLWPWLYRVTTRRCLNRLEAERVRAYSPFRFIHALFAPRPPQPDAITGARTELDRALAVLAALPPKERVAFSMHRVDGCTVAEVARIMGYSKGYVSKLIARAEEKLSEVRR